MPVTGTNSQTKTKYYSRMYAFLDALKCRLCANRPEGPLPLTQCHAASSQNTAHHNYAPRDRN